MTRTPNSVFKSFLKDIEPSPSTQSSARAAHTAMRDHLKKHETFKLVHVKTFLSGSYVRDTALRPKSSNGEVERPDVDIIVLTNYTYSDKPSDVIDHLYRATKDAYPNIRKQRRSIGVTTATADMDVVPLIAPYGENGKLYIADRSQERWLETNPPRHTEWTTEVNQSNGERFKPLVKINKWWRRENSTIGKKPKGFVIECLTAGSMPNNVEHFGELFVETLEQIELQYKTNIQTKTVPWIEDPGVAGNSVTTGMPFPSFEGYYNKVVAHAVLARKALEEEDPAKATELWRQVFGSRFPKIENTIKSLAKETARLAPLTFPNEPVRPPNRPEGFA